MSGQLNTALALQQMLTAVNAPSLPQPCWPAVPSSLTSIRCAAVARRPKHSDLLAVYAPPDAYRAGKAPVKYIELAQARGQGGAAVATAAAAAATDSRQASPLHLMLQVRGYLADGEASVLLRLINLRADMVVVFVRGGLNAPKLEVGRACATHPEWGGIGCW